jgi:hypothetical protein
MKNQKIYWCSIEYIYSDVSPESRKLIGGFVYGFVKAMDKEDALNKFADELKRNSIEIKNVEFIKLYKIETKWETTEQTNNFIKIYEQAQDSEQAIFDTFYAYEKLE